MSALTWQQELFSRIGRVSKLNLRYDRAGRSEGTAYVTYDRKEDAEEAVRQFNGANANGSLSSLTKKKDVKEFRHREPDHYLSRATHPFDNACIAQSLRYCSHAWTATSGPCLGPRG